MKLEPELADRLRAEADRLDVSDPQARRIARRGQRRARFRFAGVALAVFAVAAMSAGLGWLVTDDDAVQVAGPPREYSELQRIQEEGDESAGLEPVPQSSPPTPRKIFGANPRIVPGSASGAGGGGATESSGTSDSTPSLSVIGGAPGPATGTGGGLASPRVIKTALLRIEVGEDSLGATFGEVERLAARHGGFVSESFTRSNPARSGELEIRVPAAVFESVVADLKALGRVELQRVSGVDVTAEFVDLQARLRNWEAHERVLVRLMSEANSIAESLQVQRELQNVRVEIERILGQLRVLRDQTDLASITIAIHEPGAAEGPGGDESAWDRAVGAAGRVLEAMLVGLGYLLPILAALMVLWLVARAIRSRRTS